MVYFTGYSAKIEIQDDLLTGLFDLVRVITDELLLENRLHLVDEVVL
jgi:hypothetical protein